MEPIGRFPLLSSLSCRRFLHGHPKRLDQLAVLHAGGTGRFAGPAIETELQMAASLMVNRQPAIGDRPHQVDAAPRPIVFVAGFDVRWTGSRAESAMNTVEE